MQVEAGRSVYFPVNKKEEIKLASRLRPGDVLFLHRNLVNGGAWVDIFEMITQKLVSFFRRETVPLDCKNIAHVAIVTSVDAKTGEVYVADTMPSSGKKSALRNVPLFEQRDAILRKGTNCSYSILRAPERLANVAATAAQIASKVCVTPSYASKQQGSVADAGKPNEKIGDFRAYFSFRIGIKALFTSLKECYSFTDKAKKRVFKQLYDHAADKEVISSGRGKKGRGFICSYFVGHLLQRAEASLLMSSNSELEGKVNRFADRNIQGWQSEPLEKLSDWSKNMVKDHGSFFNEMTMAADVKKMAPQNFKMFLKERGFSEVVHIQAPKK